MRVSIIGPGRLGRSLHLICDTVGHASFLVGRTTPEPDTDIRLITVRDDDIPQVLSGLTPDRPTFHCSGVLDDAILDGNPEAHSDVVQRFRHRAHVQLLHTGAHDADEILKGPQVQVQAWASRPRVFAEVLHRQPRSQVSLDTAAPRANQGLSSFSCGLKTA